MSELKPKQHNIPDDGLTSHTDYAKHRGVTRRSVQKAYEAGRIDVWINSKGKKCFLKSMADVQWESNTRATYQRTPTNGQKKKGITTTAQAMHHAGDFSTSKEDSEIGDSAIDMPDQTASDRAKNDAIFGKVRTQKEIFKTKVEELKFKKMKGDLVEKSALITALVNISSPIKEKLMASCTRLAPEIVGICREMIEAEKDGDVSDITHRIERLLLANISTNLNDISDGVFKSL